MRLYCSHSRHDPQVLNSLLVVAVFVRLCRFSLTSSSAGKLRVRIHGRLLPLQERIVPNHFRDTDAIRLEQRVSPLSLGSTVLQKPAPGRDGLLSLPERQAENLSVFGQALKPFDRDKALAVFQKSSQPD